MACLETCSHFLITFLNSDGGDNPLFQQFTVKKSDLAAIFNDLDNLSSFGDPSAADQADDAEREGIE